MTLMNIDAHLQRALARVRAATGASVAFGGPVDKAGYLLLGQFDGRTTGALPGSRLDPHEGLGGRVVALGRSMYVEDYFDTNIITHKYDSLVRTERLRAIVAAPVIVGRQPVGVVYAAFRHTEFVGGRIQDAVAHEVRALEQELAVGASQHEQTLPEVIAENGRLREQLRVTYRDLRLAADAMPASDVRSLLNRVLADLVHVENTAPPLDLSLTKREIDVLTLAGSGMTNTQIASLLGLTLHTTKGYMKSAMRKCGATTRLEAVVVARRAAVIA